MKHKVTGAQYNSRNCFTCGVENSAGLHARFYETENNEVVGVACPDSRHQSYPGRLHGGISSAFLDETMGRAISVTSDGELWGVTLEMTLKYRKPVPYDCEIKTVARIAQDMGRIFECTAELILEDGQVAVTATGRYLKQPAEKISAQVDENSEWGFVYEGKIPEEIEV